MHPGQPTEARNRPQTVTTTACRICGNKRPASMQTTPPTETRTMTETVTPISRNISGGFVESFRVRSEVFSRFACQFYKYKQCCGDEPPTCAVSDCDDS